MEQKVRKKILDILSEISYEKCLLFGSRARGDNSPDSDYDLLIIVQNDLPGPERMKLCTRVRKALANEWINADVIIKSSSEVAYYKDKVGSIVQNAIEEGVLV